MLNNLGYSKAMFVNLTEYCQVFVGKKLGEWIRNAVMSKHVLTKKSNFEVAALLN